MIYYKIQHKITKRWSKGGAYVNAEGNGYCWSEKGGKVWDTLGKLRAHLTTHLPKYTGDYGTDMSNWQVVELEIVEKDRKDVHEVMDPKKILKLVSQ
jgi:hypothetical protein